MSQLYGVLGVARAATDEQIKAAFRKLAMTCHPDLCGGDQHAERRFQEILSAYETLCDAKRRARYDEACAEARRRAFGRLKRSAATMAVSFVLTVSSGSLIGIWLVRHVFL
jgi:curved DNA-binding protein CbpA